MECCYEQHDLRLNDSSVLQIEICDALRVPGARVFLPIPTSAARPRASLLKNNVASAPGAEGKVVKPIDRLVPVR